MATWWPAGCTEAKQIENDMDISSLKLNQMNENQRQNRNKAIWPIQAVCMQTCEMYCRML
jgi:hypothetical protein